MLLDRVIRAWKDPEYRHTLSAEDQALLPENPAGAIELTDDELEMVAGGHRPSYSSASNSSNSSARPSSAVSRRSSDKSSRRPSNSRSFRHRPSYSWRRRRR